MARRIVLALVGLAAVPGVSGCISNPEPAPLVVATPSSTPTASATASPTPTASATASPTPAASSSAPRTQKPRPHPTRRPVTADDVSDAVAPTLPRLTVHADPSPHTRVGLDTNFYTEPQAFTRTLTINGQSVAVSGKVFYYQFAFGDGASKSSTSPGKAFPQSQITHRYEKAGTYTPRVTAYFSITYSVAGGTWQSLQEKVASVGPSTTLKVLAE